MATDEACATPFYYPRVLQRQQTLGNKMETEITNLIEQNPTLLRLGLHLEYNDARNRVATHLQRNLDRSESLNTLQI